MENTGGARGGQGHFAYTFNVGTPSGVCGGRGAVGADLKLGQLQAVEDQEEEGKPGRDTSDTDSNNSTKERRHVPPNQRVDEAKCAKSH